MMLIAVILTVVTSSCSDSDDITDKSALVGNWYGTRCYVNNGTVKYQYFTLTLNSDNTGSMEYEAPSSLSLARFTWSVKGGKLICKGAYGNSDGDMSGNYTLECNIEKDRLRPIGQFSIFILTKDNSIMTDSNGNEIASAEDQLYTLQNVWVATDKTSVIKFYPGSIYDEYILSSDGSTYTEFNVGNYHFAPLNKTLTIDTSLWEVVTINNQSLVLKNGSRTLSYRMGTRDDIPTKSDLKTVLSSAFGWSDENSKYFFRFSSDGTVAYIEDSGRRYGSYGDISLIAEGKYRVSGSTVTCTFTSVNWEYGSTSTASWFPGWVWGQSCTKKYLIEVTPAGSIKVTFLDSSKVVYLDKV